MAHRGEPQAGLGRRVRAGRQPLARVDALGLERRDVDDGAARRPQVRRERLHDLRGRDEVDVEDAAEVRRRDVREARALGDAGGVDETVQRAVLGGERARVAQAASTSARSTRHTGSSPTAATSTPGSSAWSTRAPASRHDVTMALPMPPPAPTTSTVRPSRSLTHPPSRSTPRGYERPEGRSSGTGTNSAPSANGRYGSVPPHTSSASPVHAAIGSTRPSTGAGGRSSQRFAAGS